MPWQSTTLSMPDNRPLCAPIPVTDRGFQYGDGVFETLAVDRGEPLLLDRHVKRMVTGCKRLGITAPASEVLCNEVTRLAGGAGRAVIKLTVTRGDSARGYSPHDAGPPRIVAVRHPWPARADALAERGVAVRLCKTALARNPTLAGVKHLNRLEQVLGRAEWVDDAVSEGLMSDTEGYLIEGTMSNVFLVVNGELLTPDLSNSGVAGIIRDLVIEWSSKLTGRPARVATITPASLQDADEIFVCNSLIGLWPVTRVERHALPVGELTLSIARALKRARAIATRSV